MSEQFRVPPFHYIHVLDNNASVTCVLSGPTTFTKQDHERVVVKPTPMVVLPSRTYCVVLQPAQRKENTKEVITDMHGQVQLRHGDREIRLASDWPEPFVLYPGEMLSGGIQQLLIVKPDTALHLKALRKFTDNIGDKEVERVAGDEWMFRGPATYYPLVEAKILETLIAQTIGKNEALKIRAKNSYQDRQGVKRKAGEEYLVRTPGGFLPDVNEEVLGTVKPQIITQQIALHLCAADVFTDVYGIKRKAGEEWLVTSDMTDYHIQDIQEQVVGTVRQTVLKVQQYCVVLDPVSNGRNQYGTKELRVGPKTFFLLPGERLDRGIRDVDILTEGEALLLRCIEKFTEDNLQMTERIPGDLWMINGPCQYVGNTLVEVVEKRRSIPLDENEGVYVRNVKDGRVRAQVGPCNYLLQAHEELWEKNLRSEVEDLLEWTHYKGQDASSVRISSKRDKTRVVVFRVPHNAACQIYDYKAKKSRVVFGPGRVMLDPDEEFTVASLSGGKPKRPNMIQSIALMLGPDFMTDVVEVETSDHARLRIKLSYNWHFELEEDAFGTYKGNNTPIFKVRDFVGDACKAIASRVRGAVASQNFEVFHRFSAKIIRAAVFGCDQSLDNISEEGWNGKIGDHFMFNSNRLAVTNIDIQSVEPIDDRTRESLQKSVQLAIEITTRKQERGARHAAQKIEQSAKGKIEKQKIHNLSVCEEARQFLIQLQAECAAVASAGTAKAEAEAKAEYLEIEGTAEVEQAKLQAKAQQIAAQSELDEMTATQNLEISHQTQMSQLELEKQKRIADIEVSKFADLVDAIGPKTIQAIAQAGPEMQARLLKGLGLKGYLLTDGSSPVNLFNAAKGMMGTL